MRFFGDDAGTDWNRKALERSVPDHKHETIDKYAERATGNIFQ